MLLIIDGYNFIRRIPHFAAIEREHGLEDGRFEMLMPIEHYSAEQHYDTHVIFDGSNGPHVYHGACSKQERFQGIDISFSKPRESADMLIVKLIKQRVKTNRADGISESIILITDDLSLRDDVFSYGVFCRSTWELYDAMTSHHMIAI